MTSLALPASEHHEAWASCRSATASASTITSNGGVLEDVRQGVERYWIVVSSISIA